MADDEFSIIDQYFKHLGWHADAGVVLGPGDDCAILSIPGGYELCISTDTLLSGVHFPAGCSGEVVASRSFVAAMSDLAAMGATPHSFTGALTMPDVDHPWLSEFSSYLGKLSNEYQVPLVGGNLTRGVLSVTFTVLGITPTGKALRRSGAQPGDEIYVTGQPGSAGAGLQILTSSTVPSANHQPLLAAYEYPAPKISVGAGLLNLASAAIDISDGLLADLGHMMTSSQVAAELDLSAIPLSAEMLDYTNLDKALLLALTAGDDYELCFCVERARAVDLQRLAEQTGIAITRIGTVGEGEGVQLLGEHLLGIEGMKLEKSGYQHF